MLGVLRADTEDPTATGATGEGPLRSQKRIGPGLYLDDAGALQVEILELLAYFGYLDTAENRAVCLAAAVDACRRLFPDVRCTIVESDHLA